MFRWLNKVKSGLSADAHAQAAATATLAITSYLEPDAKQAFIANSGRPEIQALVVDFQMLRNQATGLANDSAIQQRLTTIIKGLNTLNHTQQSILAQLAQLLPGPAVRGTFILEERPMGFVLVDDQKASGAVKWVDAKGNQAKVDGATTYEASDPSIATVTDNGDGTFTIVAGNVGTCQVTARADADLGAGVTEVIATLDLEVVAGQAVGGSIQLSAPQPQ